MGFHDSKREGDEEWVMIYKIFFYHCLLFQKLKWRNYSIEPVDIQLQQHHPFSQQEAAQLKSIRIHFAPGSNGWSFPHKYSQQFHLNCVFAVSEMCRTLGRTGALFIVHHESIIPA